jgi:peptidoglycan endopeptidase LytE
VVVKTQPAAPLVKKTASSQPVNVPAAAAAGRTVYGAGASAKLDQAIRNRYGLPYHYGSTGPNSYDCSGFVWSAFQEAGINFTRSSAHTLWNESEPVDGPDRYKFGTLVFFNGLGHIGIVADENGFYHASSSKGITYSKFEGYWEKRIVGFRRLNIPVTVPQPVAAQR